MVELFHEGDFLAMMTTTTSTATAARHAAAAEPVSLAAPAQVMLEQVPVMMDRAWAAEWEAYRNC
jgi:hypothetical protein